MREVAVHLEYELGAVGERAAEAGDVGVSQSFLLRPMQDADERKLCRQLVGQLAGAVGGGVVDHEDAIALARDLPDRADHRLEVLELVVGRQADGRTHWRSVAETGVSMIAQWLRLR